MRPCSAHVLCEHTSREHSRQRKARRPPELTAGNLKSELERFEERGGSAVLLDKGKAKYKYAMKAQHTDKFKKLVGQIRELMKPQLLQVDARRRHDLLPPAPGDARGRQPELHARRHRTTLEGARKRRCAPVSQ